MSSAGEFAVDQLDGVEDAKGNSGQKGLMVITNLRLMWSHWKRPAINLCKCSSMLTFIRNVQKRHIDV